MSGFAVLRHGKPSDDLTRRGARWNKFTFPPMLRAAWKTKAIEEGMMYHGLLMKMGFSRDAFIETGLVGMYVGCGRVSEGRLVFDRMGRRRDVVAWNAMIDGCCQSGHFEEGIRIVEEMQSCNVKPDEMLLSAVLSACGRVGNLSYGKMIHEYIMEHGITIDSHLQTALISMYANSGCMDMARELFDQMNPKSLVISTSMISWYSKVGRLENARVIFNERVEKDVICWRAMISCYAESGFPQEAITLFKEMQASGVKPDQVTVLSVIAVCSHLGALDQAQWIHQYIDDHGFWEVNLSTKPNLKLSSKYSCMEIIGSVFL
ncbi:hypothetical protein MLD38_020481 [Melastoma candidum]|uniref:Uncharacterized protein n=1 Tax=Melastoma candidum TaxID=119954 RepID=A0ACB9QGW1_9MYRT|nr:hypothetical protein MLD38_020481 [Melastoma candidum]